MGCRFKSWRGSFKFFSLSSSFLPFGFLLFILTADTVSFERFLRKRISSKCLIRQGYHNSGEPITVVPELKRYVRNSKATYDN